MSSGGRKLALFLIVQMLGVAAMIWLYEMSRGHVLCAAGVDCARSSGVALIAAIGLIVGELALLAAVLRRDQPVWYGLVGLGALSLVIAFVVGAVVIELPAPLEVVDLLAIWHVVFAVILLLAGTAAAVWHLLEKLRRSDAALPEDQQSSAMWPLD